MLQNTGCYLEILLLQSYLNTNRLTTSKMSYIKKYFVLLGTRHLFFQEQQHPPQKYKELKLTNQLNNNNNKKQINRLKIKIKNLHTIKPNS